MVRLSYGCLLRCIVAYGQFVVLLLCHCCCGCCWLLYCPFSHAGLDLSTNSITTAGQTAVGLSFLPPTTKAEDRRQTTQQINNKQQQIHRHKTKLFIMADKSTKGRQIPIVCPGHTRPLAELQYIHVKEENRTFLVSACHGTSPCVEVSALKWNVADNDRSESLSTTRSLTHSLSNLYS